MRRDQALICLVCVFTFFVTFKPSEPFLVIFLRCVKMISRDDVSFGIFPVWTFAYLGLLPILCSLAELIGYKLVVILGAVCRLFTVMLLLVPFSDHSVPLMQLSQVTVAVGFAAHPALTAIMYRGLPREQYAKAVGFVASIGVLGEVVASLLGQLLISRGAQIWVCFALSAGFTAVGVFFATTLPSRPTVDAVRPSVLRYHDMSPSPSLIVTNLMGQRGRINQEASPATSSSSPMPPDSGNSASAEGASGGAADASLASPDGGADAEGGGCFCSSKEVRKAQLVWMDTLHLLRHSGALYYYLWLAVATAVHHLVVTYWQIGMPSHHHTSRRLALHALGGGEAAAADEYDWPSSTSSSSSPSFSSPAISLVTPIDYGSPDDSNATAMLGNGTSLCDQPPAESINGYAQAIASLLGGAITLLPMFLEKWLTPERCDACRDALMVAAPLLMAALLYGMSVLKTDYLYASSYALFHVAFELLRILCEVQGARCVAATRVRGAPRFASVSGLTTTVALSIQAVLQLAFVPRSLGIKRASMPLAQQFRIEAALLLALFAAYLAIALDRLTGGEGRRIARSLLIRLCGGRSEIDLAIDESGADSAAGRYQCYHDHAAASSTTRGTGE